MTADFEVIVDESLYNPNRPETTLNVIPRTLQEKLRKRQLPFLKSEAYLKRLKEMKSQENDTASGAAVEKREERTKIEDDVCGDNGEKVDAGGGAGLGTEICRAEEGTEGRVCGDVQVQTCGPLTDEDLIKTRPSEKRKV